MNPLRPASILTALLGLCAGALAAAESAPAEAKAAAPPAKSAATQQRTQRFKQVQERIAALYQHRNEPPPRPDPQLNPFRTPGSAPLTTAKGEGGEAAPEGTDTQVSGTPSSNLALLQQGAATLKFSGIIEKFGRAYVTINTRSYKEGDVVQTQVRSETIYLRVKEIAGRSVTLSLNDAEMTLKF